MVTTLFQGKAKLFQGKLIYDILNYLDKSEMQHLNVSKRSISNVARNVNISHMFVRKYLIDLEETESIKLSKQGRECIYTITEKGKKILLGLALLYEN